MKEIVQRIITSLILGSSFWLAYVYLPPVIFSSVLLAILAVILLYEWRHFFNMKQMPFWLIVPFYPVLPFILLIYLNQSSLYHDLLLELFLLVASFDTGSYLIGNLIGKHHIAPHISPGKTWEGFVGGYCFAVVSLIFLEWIELNKPLPAWFIFSFSLAICLIALSGDLFESWLKRKAHIKHSGDTLPGHGGFLDRFDGIMFAAFFFYLFRNQLIHLL
jgi:phosphatidate cytidylyltransferase